MSANPLIRLHDYGQSVWYDNIQRSMLQSGELQHLICDGVRGMTSNPTIFKNAIANGQEYLADIAALSRQGKSPLEIYEVVAIADVGAAADVFRPLYQQSAGEDGYVSIVEELIGPNTVNTMPPATIEAFKEHGRLRNNLTEDVAAAEATLAQLQAAGLDIDAITAQLLDEGVAAFAQSFEQLLAVVAEKAEIAAERETTEYEGAR
jgi:transaldolase